MLGDTVEKVLEDCKKARCFPNQTGFSLRNLVCKLKADGQNLVDRAERDGRELTQREEERCSEIESELRRANTAIEQTEREHAEGQKPWLSFVRDGRGASTGRGGSTWVDAMGNSIAVLSSEQNLRDTQYRSNLPGSNLDVGDFLTGLITGRWLNQELQAAAQGAGTDTAGGYFLEPTMSAQIVDLARNKSVLQRAGAQTVIMPTSELAMVKITGDPSVSWTGENSTLSFTTSTFGRVTFRARKMGCIVKLSQELVEDAPNASQIIRDQLGKQLALEMDRAGLLGDAAGEEPTGIFNHPDVQGSSVGGSPSYDNFLDAIELAETQNGVPNAYIVSPSTKNTLSKLKDSQNQYLAPPVALTGLDRLVTNQLDTSRAVLGDMSQVMFGVRVGVRVEVSRIAGTAYQDDQVWIRARWRGDIQLAHANHIVALTGIT
ncbi:MAG: phage major capsid protein [Nitrococcus sp.]|nr:phage major capsid protein [Nitrococcus sp.]